LNQPESRAGPFTSILSITTLYSLQLGLRFFCRTARRQSQYKNCLD